MQDHRLRLKIRAEAEMKMMIDCDLKTELLQKNDLVGTARVPWELLDTSCRRKEMIDLFS